MLRVRAVNMSMTRAYVRFKGPGQQEMKYWRGIECVKCGKRF